MTCDTCGQKIEYCFYINDELWAKVVGPDKASSGQGYECAHCVLTTLGGLHWYIIWNEPTQRIKDNVDQAGSEQEQATVAQTIPSEP